ncbi:MAG: CRTAC1 family protein, partial [Gemmatimonadota bacterium]
LRGDGGLPPGVPRRAGRAVTGRSSPSRVHRRACWLALLAAGCGTPEPPAAGGPRPWPVAFEDIAPSAGITVENVSGKREKTMIIEAKGGGIGWLDYDGDGDLDLYVINGSTIEPRAGGAPPSNRLYRNEGGYRFADVTAAAGVGDTSWSMGCAAADYDNDGDQDLFVTNYGRNRLYRNRGDGTYADATEEAGVGGRPRWSTGACFGDYDGDGDLDLYVANYVRFAPAADPQRMPYQLWKGLKIFQGPNAYEGETNELYENDGAGRFVEVTGRNPAMARAARRSFQCVFADLDDDGDPDLYVANDSDPNLLYRNDGKGRFADVSFASGSSYSDDGDTQAGMGVAVGDYDGDADLDLFVTHFSEDYNTLYRNDGGGLFADASYGANTAEVSMPWVSWGTGFHDFDNDGDLDLFVANGHVYPIIDAYDVGASYAQPNAVLWSDGRGRFAEVEEPPGGDLGVRRVSRGAAFGDFDNDGDVDVAVLNADDTPSLYRNDGGNRGHWLQVSTVGQRSNRDGIGARLRVSAGGRVQVREVMGSYSFLSQSELRVHFGLGAAARVDLLEIRWPAGGVQQFRDVVADQWLVVSETDGIVSRR